jgi:N-acetylmuramic acid 6-phosphate (MurNAc-6-P) etherase
MDSTLEKEHPKFMELSQLCNNLVQRFDSENMAAAARIRKQFDSITQQWENIVTRLEEQSQMVCNFNYTVKSLYVDKKYPYSDCFRLYS